MTKKESLMRAAKELFSELGYEGTTFKKISDRAGVALGLLSHHFGSKERLFLAASLEVLDKQYEHVCRESLRGESGLEKVMLFSRSYLDFASDPENCYRMLPLCAPHCVAQEAGKARLNAGYIRLDILLEHLIAEGKADGTVAADAPSSMANVITCTLMGVMRLCLLTSCAPAGLKEDTLAAMRRALVTVNTLTGCNPSNPQVN